MPSQPNTGSRVLFWLSFALAGLLLAVVCLTPLLDDPDEVAIGWHRVVALFARDATLRRTCLASAVGLVVSAFVFFQKPRPPVAGQAQTPPRPRRRDMAGA